MEIFHYRWKKSVIHYLPKHTLFWNSDELSAKEWGSIPRNEEQYGSPMSGVVMLTMGVAQDVDDSNVYDEQWNNDVRDLVNKM